MCKIIFLKPLLRRLAIALLALPALTILSVAAAEPSVAPSVNVDSNANKTADKKSTVAKPTSNSTSSTTQNNNQPRKQTDFTPSEELSGDYSVAFPVDI